MEHGVEVRTLHNGERLFRSVLVREGRTVAAGPWRERYSAAVMDYVTLPEGEEATYGQA